jgi:hypothetical protein
MVKFWQRKKWDKSFSESIARRISRIPTNDLVSWADQALTGVGRSLSEYMRTQDEPALKELVSGAEALHALAYEIDKRTHARF